MISPRFAWPAAALLIVALVPTLLNTYRAPDAIGPGSLERELPGAGGSEPGRRKQPWVREVFGAEDFATRHYPATSLDLFAARTYDGKKLFHFPELALSYGRAATDTRIEDMDGVPVRVLEFGSRPSEFHMAMYTLYYGRRTVRDPVPFLLSILPERFVGRREPMTLIYVQGSAQPGGREKLARELRALLAASTGGFRR